MERYAVTISGCDDCTPVVMSLTESDLGTVEALALLAGQVSRYGCMPTIEVRPATERDESDFTEALAEKAADA